MMRTLTQLCEAAGPGTLRLDQDPGAVINGKTHLEVRSLS